MRILHRTWVFPSACASIYLPGHLSMPSFSFYPIKSCRRSWAISQGQLLRTENHISHQDSNIPPKPVNRWEYWSSEPGGERRDVKGVELKANSRCLPAIPTPIPITHPQQKLTSTLLPSPGNSLSLGQLGDTNTGTKFFSPFMIQVNKPWKSAWSCPKTRGLFRVGWGREKVVEIRCCLRYILDMTTTHSYWKWQKEHKRF